MIGRVIEACVRNRGLVLLVAAMAAFASWWAVRTTAVDALPDLSDVQVIVYTEMPGQSPQVVEDQVGYPLSTALLAVPHARDVRGYSFFGFSLIYVIFEDGTDLYWARSRVMEALNAAAGRLPQGVTPQLGPDATGVGWVYQYALSDFGPRARTLRQALDSDHDAVVGAMELPEPAMFVDGMHVYAPDQLHVWLSPEGVGFLLDGFDRDRDGLISAFELERAANFRGLDLSQLRSIQDWYLRYDLTAVPGVAEVASVGGFVRQYQVEVDPERLRAFGVTVPQVRDAIRRANLDTGGRLLEMGETEFMVRGQGYIRSVGDLETIPIKVDVETHTPVFLRQVASVHLGPEARRGLVDLDGKGEVVGGIVVMRSGENARAVIDRVGKRLEELKRGMPEGVEVHVTYDRSGLIDRAVGTLTSTLLLQMVIVVLVCVLLLGHLRSAGVALISLPLGVGLAFVGMRLLDVNANIMSLSGIAIAIGVMVDAAVVMVENVHRWRERDPDAPQEALVIRAAKEVGPALFFSLLVVTVSFLPVFALEQQEGRLFRPLALTKTFAMAASAVLAITVIPALMVWLVRGRIRPEQGLSRWLSAAYRPVLAAVLRVPAAVVAIGLLISVSSLWPMARLGCEFMPPLDEGDLLYMPTTPPGLSITKAREVLQRTDRLIAAHPQVVQVYGKVGRADTATDPAPLTMIETTIQLTPRDTWPRGKRIEDVIAELDATVRLPGLTNAWTMPIRTRIDMLATGIRTPVGIKLLGDDLDVLSATGAEIEAVLREFDPTAAVFSERVVGGNYVDIRIRREDAARFGLNVADVNDVVSSAIGGMNVTETVEGLERYPVNVRFPRELRDDIAALRAVAVPTPLGHTVPLVQVADIEITQGPPSIKSENARRTAWIFVDPDTTDIGGWVSRARRVVDKRVQRPTGVALQWSGQYAYMQRAWERLWLIGPLTLALIVLLLYAHFRSAAPTAMVLLGTVVFAPLGGLWALYLADYNLSVAAAVGFIALLGLAAENGVVMLVYLEQARDRAAEAGLLRTPDDLRIAVLDGATSRLRPVLMTAGTDALALLPVMLAAGTGSRVMHRIAMPMLGGLVSATLLSLLILPAVYLLWHRRHQSDPIGEG